MNNANLTEQIHSCIHERNSEQIKKLLSGMHSSEIADIIESLDTDEHAFVLDSLDIETASEVFFELDIDKREEILAELDDERIAHIAEEMDSDDAADLIGELSDEKAESVLSRMDPEEVRDVEPLLMYPADTAGGIMQSELVKVNSDTTVRDSINWIRLIADDIEEFHGIYVVDRENRLLGFVPLRKLVIANPRSPVSSEMEPVEISATPYMDQEEVADLFRRYDVVTLPVVDDSNKLLGRITSDDILDVISEEAEEDMYQFAGMADHLHPIFTPTYERIKLRTPWLLLTLVGELLIAFIIIHAFQPTLEKVAILAAFMPAIMAMGGNVGIQTTTIIIRSLGLGTVNIQQIMKLIISEVKVGFALGIICGSIAAVIGLMISYNEPQVIKLAATVLVAMVSATIATSFVGVAAPILLSRAKLDPAASSGPFLTMFNDLFGSLFYLFVAMLIF